MSDKRSAIDRMERQNPVPPESDLQPPVGGVDRILAHDRDRDRDRSGAAPGGRRRQPVLLAAAGVVLVAGVAVGGILVAGGDRSGTIPAGPPPAASFALPPTDPDLVVLPPSTVPEGAAPTAPMLHFVAYSRPVSATDLLRHLSDRAAQQSPARGTGPYEYMQRRGWYLSSAQTTDGTILGWDTAVTDREQWLAEDGSGRVDITENGAAQSLPASPMFSSEDRIDSDAASVPVLRERLLTEGSGRSTQQWFGAFTDTWTTRIVSPALQAAFLDVLAEQPGIDVLGAVTDRVGREGVAVSTNTGDRQLVLVFDEHTGALLDHEQIALTPAATDVPIALPSTVNYTVWLDRGYVHSIGDRP